MAGPIIGQGGSVTFTSGYVLNVKSWTLNIVADEHDITDFASTADWGEYMTGLKRWSGSYECFLDESTAFVLPGFEPFGSALVLTSSLGRTFSGNAISTSGDITANPADPNKVTVNFRGTGTLAVG